MLSNTAVVVNLINGRVWQLKKPALVSGPDLLLDWFGCPVGQSRVDAAPFERSLVDDEVTKHGEVMAREGADKLIGACRRSGEGCRITLARAQHHGVANDPGVIYG